MTRLQHSYSCVARPHSRCGMGSRYTVLGNTCTEYHKIISDIIYSRLENLFNDHQLLIKLPDYYVNFGLSILNQLNHFVVFRVVTFHIIYAGEFLS